MSPNRRIVIKGVGDAQIVEGPIPKLPSEEFMLVKTKAVALNPTDWKHVELANVFDCVGSGVGCDYAGEVVEVGSAVTKDFKKGDRVCGPVHGSNTFRHEDGTFGEYIVVKGDLQIKTPDNLSDEEASTLGIAVTTVGQALYQTLDLPLPPKKADMPFPIFIYGGTTAMGISGIQYAKLSGLTVIATASPKNFAYLKSLGADEVLDYTSPTLVEDVRRLTGGKLAHAWDCHATADSARVCAAAMADSGGQYTSLLHGTAEPVAGVNARVSTVVTLYYTVFNERDFMMGEAPPATANYEFGKAFWELSRGLLAEGRIRPIRLARNRGGSGLEGVLAGLKIGAQGGYSAEKLVYTL